MTKPNLPTCFMRAAPFPNVDLTRTYDDLFVADPLSPSTMALWRSTAKLNTAIFSEVFKPVPSDAVQTMEQLKVAIFDLPFPTEFLIYVFSLVFSHPLRLIRTGE